MASLSTAKNVAAPSDFQQQICILANWFTRRHGVYAVRVRIDGEDKWRGGVANFGRTPTTGLRDPLLEAVIFDWEGDLYGKRIEVAMVKFMRPELKFDELDDMIAQMHKDVEAAKSALSS